MGYGRLQKKLISTGFANKIRLTLDVLLIGSALPGGGVDKGGGMDRAPK